MTEHDRLLELARRHALSPDALAELQTLLPTLTNRAPNLPDQTTLRLGEGDDATEDAAPRPPRGLDLPRGNGARYALLNYRIARAMADGARRPMWLQGDYFGDLFDPNGPRAPAAASGKP